MPDAVSLGRRLIRRQRPSPRYASSVSLRCVEVRPPLLQPGDVVRLVSPASTPNAEQLELQTGIFMSWGLTVEHGNHAFDRCGFLAGSDVDRASDINDALRDSRVRAIVATRGGKGSYRLVDHLDYRALQHDPKFLVGFSDITALHFAMWNKCKVVGLHGGLFAETDDVLEETVETLRSALMDAEPMDVVARSDESTSVLTTAGKVTGRLLGGNLDLIGTSASWLLPDLRGAILLIEAVDMGLGLTDRLLLMLRKGGYLDGIAGLAIGQFSKFELDAEVSVIDLLREHLGDLDVPILGGLPIGHGYNPVTVPLGRMARLDADRGRLEFIV